MPFLRNAVRVGRVDEIAAVRETTASLTQKTGTGKLVETRTQLPSPRGDLLTSFSFQDDRYRWLIRIVGVDR